MTISEQEPAPNEMLAEAAALPYLPGALLPYAGIDTEDVRRWLFSRGWLIANGAELRKKDFRLLWFFIRDKYGSAHDAVFNIPDLQGRAPIGSGQGSGLTKMTLGSKIGAEHHTLRDFGFIAGRHDAGDEDDHARFKNPNKDLDRKISVIQPSLVLNFIIYFGRSEAAFETLAASGE